jgi:hypothetical protein
VIRTEQHGDKRLTNRFPISHLALIQAPVGHLQLDPSFSLTSTPGATITKPLT